MILEVEFENIIDDLQCKFETLSDTDKKILVDELSEMNYNWG